MKLYPRLLYTRLALVVGIFKKSWDVVLTYPSTSWGGSFGAFLGGLGLLVAGLLVQPAGMVVKTGVRTNHLTRILSPQPL